MHGVGRLQVAQGLVLVLTSSHGHAVIEGDQEGAGIADHQSPIRNCVDGVISSDRVIAWSAEYVLIDQEKDILSNRKDAPDPDDDSALTLDESLVMDVPDAVDLDQQDDQEHPVEDKKSSDTGQLVDTEVSRCKLLLGTCSLRAFEGTQTRVGLMDWQNDVKCGKEAAEETQEHGWQNKEEKGASNEPLLPQVRHPLDVLQVTSVHRCFCLHACGHRFF